MYVTVEPCPMCAGAIVQARIPRLVFGTRNKKAGCAGSVINLLQIEELNHQVDITEGVLQEECSSIMTEFFKRFRKKALFKHPLKCAIGQKNNFEFSNKIEIYENDTIKEYKH